jgi:hypothetical protein
MKKAKKPMPRETRIEVSEGEYLHGRFFEYAADRWVVMLSHVRTDIEGVPMQVVDHSFPIEVLPEVHKLTSHMMAEFKSFRER